MRTIIERSECKPLSDNIEGKIVVIGSQFFKEQYRDAKYQLAVATGGFGCHAGKMGNAVFVTECINYNPESYRQERYNLIGEPTDELIAEWKALYGEFNDDVLKILKNNAN